MPLNFDGPVLVVDDYPIAAEMTAALAKKIGFSEVDVSFGGRHALDRIRERRYGLVISDLTMPDLNGIELLQAVRGDDDLTDTLFAIMTVHNEPIYRAASIGAGADAFLVRPFGARALKKALQAMPWRAS